MQQATTIRVYALVAQKLAVWEVRSLNHQEAINAVKAAAQVEGPVLALIK